ncbi:Subtilisin-like protease SBT5.6 [Linum grandiflorum]
MNPRKNNLLLVVLLLFCFSLLEVNCYEEHKNYIVYLGEHVTGEKTPDEILQTHHSYLSAVKDSDEDAESSLIYSYKHTINGFAASLTPRQVSRFKEMEEVVAVIESRPEKYSTQTTRSWEFSGLNVGAPYNKHTDDSNGKEGNLLQKAAYGKSIIVGILDSGVWPESESFSDEGMEPVPKSWKGICQAGQDFNSSHCNKKIIGARYYLKGLEKYRGKMNETLNSRSARDMDGHGSHTASTVAGRQVHKVSALGGFASGTASGGAPLARLAIYKVCWNVPNRTTTFCTQEDMLAGMDQAIADGVHVISISIGTDTPIKHTDDALSIGAFHALKKNIIVVCAAGNNGPAPGTLSNPPPWILTVGASSVDRKFHRNLVLGNGKIITGETMTPYNLEKTHPLIYAADAVHPKVAKNEMDQCLPNSLLAEKVKGKIVLCMRGAGLRILKGVEVKRAGGAGFILGNAAVNEDQISVDSHVLPATAVLYKDALEIIAYINSTKENSTAEIGKADTVLGYRPAPFMASFTSRGPNVIHPYVLKPDISAPGLNILAAWTQASSTTQLSKDHDRIVKYNFDSGTSMATPHVAALAALLRAIHPTWSTAAIRSAIITTASRRNNKGEGITDESGKTATPFDFGAGYFRPAKAADPGLVYNASYKDYFHYLCSYGVKNSDRKRKCPKSSPPVYDLNYPSVSVPKLNGTITIKRTVTNVGGEGKTVYFFSAKPPVGILVKARPSVLFFNRVGQRKRFKLRIRARKGKKHNLNNNGTAEYVFGWFTWRDDYHVVRSPIAVSLASS